MTNNTFKIRPYARLLTMLGEQLIKNEQIALAELIKNAYDADADWIKIRFVDFEEEIVKNAKDEEVDVKLKLKKEKIKDENGKEKTVELSKIIIEDNGCGMSIDTIKNNWMNPATPNKKAKNGEEKTTPIKKRVIQGEKGIGRFATLKLGRKIDIITRQKNDKEEHVIDYDLSAYDDDFLSVNGKEKELYIEDILINVYSHQAKMDNGTKIEISNLKGEWSKKKIKEVNDESQKLQSIFDRIFEKKSKDNFEIIFEINGKRLPTFCETTDKLSTLLENNAVLKITDGKYNESECIFEFNVNRVPYKFSITDPTISGLQVFQKHNFKKDLLENIETDCGNFSFNFFVFDFTAGKESKYHLDKEDKKLIKDHRIYLYRDKIRVAPYGDSDNDWIGTDKKRAVGRSGDYLSNDQVVGFVDITKKYNPKLKDKTNREGLIEDGNTTGDFIALLQTILLYVRQHPYAQYKKQQEQIERQKNEKLHIVDSKFATLKEIIKDNPNAIKAYDDAISSYNIQKEYYKTQIDITTDLAGVGLSVETASHDIMLMLNKGVDAIDDLIIKIESKAISEKEIHNELLRIRGMFSFVNTQMKDIQLLFKSSKQRRRDIRVSDILEKVEKIYSRSLSREKIKLEIKKIGSPVVAKCTDAVLLQLFINLFDNSIYWLSLINIQSKKICVILDGNNGQVIFSDNGPGIRDDDKPYIFEEFYSGKGEDGRGLGLYIARQLLTRMDYSIDLAELQSETILPGANFVISFVKNEENGENND